MKLQFKFKDRCRATARKEVLLAVEDCGAQQVRPLFPGENDPELSRIYVVEFRGKKTGAHLLKILRSAKAVEFVEPEVRRKLMRSTG